MKIKRVVKNTLAAETLALEPALESCYMIKSFIRELKKIQQKIYYQLTVILITNCY